MLWLGFKRGIGFRRVALGTAVTSAPLVRKGPGGGWYAGVMALSLVSTVAVTLLAGALSDEGGQALVPTLVLWVVEAIIMGFALMQGLRIGWNAVAISVDTASFSLLTENGASSTASASNVAFPTADILPAADDEAKAKKRAQNIRRGQIALGCISVIFTILAVYFHIVAHEMTKPDSGNDAAVQAVAQALGDSTTSSPSTQTTPTASAPAQPGTDSAVAANPASANPSSGGVTQDNSTQTQAGSTLPSNGLPPDDPKALWALQNAGAADPSGGAVNLDTFPFATSSGAKSRDGYPIYLIECNVGSHQCVGETGQPIGSAAEVANTITPVRNADALRYSCPDWICVDLQGNVVGSVASAMRPYLAKTHEVAP